MYSTFAAELIQPTFRQLTFSLLPYCSMGDYPEAMVEVRTEDALPNANDHAWLVGKRKSGCRMWTDGSTLCSYQMVIGITQPDGYKVLSQLTARTGNYFRVSHNQLTLQSGGTLRRSGLAI